MPESAYRIRNSHTRSIARVIGPRLIFTIALTVASDAGADAILDASWPTTTERDGVIDGSLVLDRFDA